MNKIQALQQRKLIVAAAERRSDAAISTFTPSPPNKLTQRQLIANTALGFEMRQVPLGEIDRIVTMPIVLPMDEFEREEYNRQNVSAAAFESGWRLFDMQAEGFMAYDAYNGLFAPIGVGFGKTLISLAIANKAYQKGKKKILLIVPPQVLNQLTLIDIKFARTKIPFNVPYHIIGGKDYIARKMLCESNKKGLYIMTYSYLSVKDTTEMLEAIKPETIICDEVHNLANRGSARTKRLMAYIDKYKPEGVALSGTITNKSIRDYFHLIKWCLREYNPLPNSLHLANEWATVIDADASGEYGEGGTGYSNADVKGATGPLIPLIRWAQRTFKDEKFSNNLPGFRKAYKSRLNTAPGVVSSGDAEIGTSLIMTNVPVEETEKAIGYKKLEELIEKVNREWLTPNDDEIEHAIHCWKWLYELNAGFYNQLTWPTEEALAERKKIDLSVATDLLRRAKEHHVLGQHYAKLLRKWLQDKSFGGCDTPMLVGKEMTNNGWKNVGEDLFSAWRDWKTSDFPLRPERDKTAIRVCGYKVKQAIKWAQSTQDSKNGPIGGIIWVYHQEAGLWCYQELVKARINAVHCPAGDQHNAMLAAEDHPLKDKIIVASITAHGTGKNLQYFSNNYFLQWPRQAVAAEQTLGRTHRSGQMADELIVYTNLTSEFDQLNFAACLNDALYIHQTTGNKQKLIYANYDPLPKIFPSAVLIERGAEAHRLNAEQARLMREKFEGA